MKYLRSGLIYFLAALILCFCQPYLFYTKKIMQKDYETGMAKLFGFAQTVVRLVFKIAKVKLVIEGLEEVPKKGAVLFVGNHQSNFDIVALLAGLPRPAGFIAKEELQKIPFLGKWAEGIGSKFIPRGETRKSLEVVIETIKFLKTHNHGIVVFPEGTRSKTGKLGEFKAGSLKMATKSNATLVPFAIKGSSDVMKHGSFIFTPSTIHLTFLKAYLPESLKTYDTVELATTLRNEISEKVEGYES